MDNDERKDLIAARQKAIETAQDSCKQIITISSALIALALGSFASGFVDHVLTALIIQLSSIAFFASVVLGILSLFALTGMLASGAHLHRSSFALVDNEHYKIFGKSQFFAFLLGIFIIVTGIILWPHVV